VGSIGTMATYSFYANKIITTGEGGMVTTNDPALAKRCASLKSLAYGTGDRFMHQELGYNYRLPNLQAAIGCAQMTKIDRLIEAKRDLAARYGQRLAHLETLQLPVQKDYARNVYWMYHVVLRNEGGKTRDEVMKELQALGVETRAGFTPYNMQRCFIERGLTSPELCPVANNLARNAFYLPSTPGISDDDMDYVAECLTRVLA